MNGWLRPISLRLAERGPSLGGSRVRSEDIRQPQAFLGQARLRSSYELGSPAHLGQEPKCCNAPDGTTKCYDHTDGVCQNTWNSAAPTPGAPSCIQDSRGEWVHPDCRYSPPPPTARLAGGVRQLPLVVVNFGPMPGRSHMMGQAQQKLVACVNGPDLYDIYNPDMSLVANGVLNPNAQYPGAQIDFPKGPPCPVPQATGIGGLCDIPHGYEPLPGGGAKKSAVGCWNSKTGWTLFDANTGEVIGTHISGACLSLIGSFSPLPDGDPRCSGGSAQSSPSSQPAPTPTSTPTSTPAQPTITQTPPLNVVNVDTGGGSSSQPLMNSAIDAANAAIPTVPLSQPPSNEPIPATGVPVLPPTQQMTTASPPTGAFPGQPFAAPMANNPVPIAKAPAPLPPACPLGPVPLRQWAEGCMGK